MFPFLFSVNQALETLMAMIDEGLNSADQGCGTEREAPAVYEDVAVSDEPEALEKNGFQSVGQASESSFDQQVVSEVGGVVRENNRISFIDVYSNEIYCSNEDLYEGESNENFVNDGSDSSNLLEASDEPVDKSSPLDSQVSDVTNHVRDPQEDETSSAESHPEVSQFSQVTNADQRENSKPESIHFSIHPSNGPNSRPACIPPGVLNQNDSKDLKPSNQYWIKQKKLVMHKIRCHEPVFVVLRGISGSGKTTLANQLKLKGVIVSTDDYFLKRIKGRMVYDYNPMNLGEAHEWNKQRTETFLSNGRTPIIIDNTMTQIWEMKPYLALGIKYGYSVFILEPTTPWKFKARELTLKSSHGVPRKSIERMLQRYENKHPDEILRNVCQELNLLKMVTCDSMQAEKSAPKADEKTVDKKEPYSCSNNSSGSTTSPQDYKQLNLQDLMSLMQDSDCSKSGPDDCSEISIDLNSWEAVTEQDNEFSWSGSPSNFANPGEKSASTPASPDKQLKSCLKKSEFSSSVDAAVVKGVISPTKPSSACVSGNWDVISLNVEANDESANPNPESPGKQPKKRKRSRPSRNLKMPLIDPNTKAKLSSENWVLPKFPTSSAIEPDVPVHIPKSLVDGESLTTIEDFVMLYKIQNDVIGAAKNMFSIMTCSSPLPPSSDIELSLTANARNSSVMMLDKSCMTDKPPPISFEEALASLQQMFQTLPAADLSDILEKCHGDHSWAVNILLDSGTDFIYESSTSNKQLTNEDKVSLSIPDVIDVSHNRLSSSMADSGGCTKTDISLIESNASHDVVPMKLDPLFIDVLIQSFGSAFPNLSTGKSLILILQHVHAIFSFFYHV